MVVFSIIMYVSLAIWFLIGSRKHQMVSMVIGTCLSSFLAFWHWDIDNLAMVIYLILGVVCIFFFWISFDSKSTKIGAAKNKYICAVLALFLGRFGIHRFYLRKPTSGLLYVLICWSFIPVILGIVEAIRLFAMSQTKFDMLYNSESTTTHTNTPIEDVAQEQPLQEKEYAWDADEDDNPGLYNSVNNRNGDNLNYRDIRLYGYKATAVGSVEDFSIVVKGNGNTYTFKAKNGDICSYRSSSMRATKYYEVR